MTRRVAFRLEKEQIDLPDDLALGLHDALVPIQAAASTVHRADRGIRSTVSAVNSSVNLLPIMDSHP